MAGPPEQPKAQINTGNEPSKRIVAHINGGKVPITFVSSEPYIGHLGLGGVGDSKSMLESEMRGHDIKWITNAKTTKVEAGKLDLDRDGDAAVGRHERLVAACDVDH